MNRSTARLSIVAVALRHELHVCDVYRAVIDGELTAQLPKVEGDRVILEGTVRSWFEKHEAERVAWSAPGVTSVENRIIVSL